MARPKYCAPCDSEPARLYLQKRVREGALLERIAQEMSYLPRIRAWGITKAPDVSVLELHMRRHEMGMAPVSMALETFDQEDDGKSIVPKSTKDAAVAVVEAGMMQLESGKMEIKAQHLLKAQELLDRREERAQNRELMVVMARLLTTQQAPPPKYVGEGSLRETIEGEVTEVELEPVT